MRQPVRHIEATNPQITRHQSSAEQSSPKNNICGADIIFPLLVTARKSFYINIGLPDLATAKQVFLFAELNQPAEQERRELWKS